MLRALTRWGCAIAAVLAFYAGALMPLVGEAWEPYFIGAGILALLPMVYRERM